MSIYADSVVPDEEEALHPAAQLEQRVSNDEMLLSGNQLTICQKIILLCLRLGQEAVLLWVLLFTRMAYTTSKHLLPLPINFQAPTLAARLLLALIIQYAQTWLERAFAVPP